VRVVIATVRTPFTRGEPERLAAALQEALTAAGHEADIMALPFSPSSAAVIPDQMLAFRLMQAAESSGVTIDRLVALAFPATLIPHPAKRLWLQDLYRPAYDEWAAGTGFLWNAPGGRHVRQAIHVADAAAMAESTGVFASAPDVGARLRDLAGVEAEVLRPPTGQSWDRVVQCLLG
jgi:hypothetical protein